MLNIESQYSEISISTEGLKESDNHLLDIHTSALLRLTLAIETATTLDELLLLALSETTKLLNVPRSGIVLVPDERDSVQLVSLYPPRVTLPPPIALSDMPYLRQVIEHRQSVQLYDLHDEPNRNELVCMLQEDDVFSVLLVPLVAQDKVIGVLGMGTLKQPRTFSTTEVALLRVLTGPLAAAISAFITTEAARRHSAEIATLNDIAAAITSSLDAREIYHLVVRQLNEYFDVEAGSLLMRDDETGALQFVMTLEGEEEKLAGVEVPCGQGVAGQVAENQRYEIVNDAQNDPRVYKHIGDTLGYQASTILCVPMIVKGRTIGVIELLNKHEGNFTDKDAERLMHMASTIGVAIENARLFQQVATGRDRLEAILNSSNDGILMADMRGIIVTANPTAARLFKQPSEELIGRPITIVLEELRNRSTVVSSPLWLHNDTDDTGISNMVELEMTGSSGAHSYIRHFSLPVYDAAQVVIGQLMMFQDVSKERELAQLRDDFTGMLVHDLRAPLTAIMNGIMMMRRGLGGPVSEQQHDLLNISYQSSQTMLDMVNTLLDIAKMEQGRMPLTYEPISPYALVDETTDRLRASAQDARVTLTQKLGVGLPLLEADREKLVRILQNLLDNAIKFSPKHSEVTLGVAHVQVGQRQVNQENGMYPEAYYVLEQPDIPVVLPDLREDDWLLFWVSDQGAGVPAKYHDRIFEKFGQVRGDKKARGTGLGLTFCRLATESHGGHIWLESMEGQGSTFALVLPLVRDRSAE